MVLETLQLSKGEEVDVVGRVDSLGSAEDGVRNRDATPEVGRVFDIINAA